MTFDNFIKIVENHIKTVVAPQSQSPLVRFAIGAALGSGLVRERIRPPLEAIGAIRRAGDAETVDTARIAAALRGGFDAAPELKMDFMGIGFTFRRDDAEALLREMGV